MSIHHGTGIERTDTVIVVTGFPTAAKLKEVAAEPTATEAQMRADLAHAMGWYTKAREMQRRGGNVVTVYVLFPPGGGSYDLNSWSESEEKIWASVPFDPFTSAEDSRALVAWLAADDALWNQFDLQMFYLRPSRYCEDTELDVAVCVRRWHMTAPLPVIARAAWLAIQGCRDE